MKKYVYKNNIKILLKNPKGLDDKDLKWNLMYNELIKFKTKHGHCNVPQQKPGVTCIPELVKLASWCGTQRQYLKKGKLLLHRHKKLIEIGFDFEPFDTRWEKYFSQLLHYKAIHGHCNVPQNKKERDPLAVWVNKQRDHRNTMHPDKKKRLLDIGFVFEVMNYWWEEYYKELVEYKKLYGNTAVSEYNKEYYILAKWVSRMRASKLAGNRKFLTEEQEARLEELGFDWTPELTKWNKRYDELLNFYEKYGHINVPYSYDYSKGLGGWVKRQMKNKKILSDKQIDKLNKLGITWQEQKEY